MPGRPTNRVNVNVSTVGAGSPFTTTTAVASFRTLAADCHDVDIVEYSIVDGTNWEDGWGVVAGGGTTITRNVFDSSNAGAAISLSGSATCIVTLTAQGAAPYFFAASRLGNSV